jgi:acetyl esterase/lipase
VVTRDSRARTMHRPGVWFGGDPSRMAVAGESAGGNMALDVALKATRADRIAPVAMLLIYPVAGTSTDTPSYRRYAQAKPLSRAMMTWFFSHELTNPSEAKDSGWMLSAPMRSATGACLPRRSCSRRSIRFVRKGRRSATSCVRPT